MWVIYWGWKIMGGKDYMPTGLGGWGKGDFSLSLVNIEYHKQTEGFREYCVITMGYHVGSIVMHFAGARKSDFLEMTLHHLIALYMYSGCFLCNFWECGGVIMYLHDIADASGNFVKGSGETPYGIVSGVTMIGHMYLWAYTRMWVLPNLIYQIAIHGDNYGDHPYVNPKWIFCYLLSCMVLLHTFWFHIFCKMLYNYAFKGKRDDIQ